MDIPSPSTKASSTTGSSPYSGANWAASSTASSSAWGDQVAAARTVLVQSRPVGSSPVKKVWTASSSAGGPVVGGGGGGGGGHRTNPSSSSRGYNNKEDNNHHHNNKTKTSRPVNSEAAPKSRVHFTADGSIPVCRMPNCRRPMYFYKNEDRWRCNLNRGGCGAVFHNVGRDIGPCSKCQRPVGEPHPCHEWCVCRYCTSSKKHLDAPPADNTPSIAAVTNNNQSEWTASPPPTS